MLLLGGTPRERYRAWLSARAGEAPIVVGTRPAVFAPLPGLGLIWISREAHAALREDRAPYYHVRDVAAARAPLEGAACVLASLAPSVETALAVAEGRWARVRAPRSPGAWRRPAGGDHPARRGGSLAPPRAAAPGRPLGRAHRVPPRVRGGPGLPGLRGAARPAPCAGGPIVLEGGRPACRSAERPGGASTAGRTGSAWSEGAPSGSPSGPPAWPASRWSPVPGRAMVRSPGRAGSWSAAPSSWTTWSRLRSTWSASSTRTGRSLAPGSMPGEQALATWMEAAAWAGRRDGGGRVLVQTRHPGHPAVQALVRWEPEPFLLREARARSEAGFPPGHPVFRVIGSRRSPRRSRPPRDLPG